MQNHDSGAQLPVQWTLDIFSAGLKHLGHGDVPPLHRTSSWRAIEYDHLHFTLYYSDGGGSGGSSSSSSSSSRKSIEKTTFQKMNMLDFIDSSTFRTRMC